MGPWLRRLARMALSEAAIATTWRCTSIPAPLAPIQWLPLAATAPAPALATATFAHLWALVSATAALVSATAAVVAGAKALVAARALALADLRAVVAARAYHALVAVREMHALVAAGALALSRS